MNQSVKKRAQVSESDNVRSKKQSNKNTSEKSDVESEITRNNLYLTGIPKKAFITNAHNKALQVLGTVIEIEFFENEFPPQLSSSALDRLSSCDVVLDALCDGPFKNMTTEEKISYVRRKNIEGKKYFSDHDFPAQVRIVSMGEGKEKVFCNLPEDDQSRLLEGTTMFDMHRMINREKLTEASFDASKDSRHNLVFRPDNWKLFFPVVREVNEYLIYDLERMWFLHNGEILPSNCHFFPTDFQFSPNVGPLAVCFDRGDEVSEVFEVDTSACMSWYTPAVKKSAIQKVIRFGPQYVDVTDHGSLDAGVYLETLSRSLCIDKGSLNPDLKLFVRGSESYFKRLAITICEDASLDNSIGDDRDAKIVCTLFIAALMCRFHWKPTEAFFQRAVTWSKEALSRAQYYDYDNQKEIKFRYQSGVFDPTNCWEVAVLLLEELKAFEGDIRMMKLIHKKRGRQLLREGVVRPREMKSTHVIDQHSVTTIVHLLPSEMTFPERFDFMWKTQGL